MMRILSLVAAPLMLNASNYTAEKTVVDSIEVVRLKDAARNVEVAIVPSIGNNAYELKVKGRNVLWTTSGSPADLTKTPRSMMGNPLLAPWANRLDQDAFYANGKKFLLNPELNNFRYDPNHLPIHGLVVYAPWQVVRMAADSNSASITSRLEFWRHPEWMAQFPFAHTIEMTYCLKDGVLEVETAVENLSAETMPLSLGYHTYYQLPGSKRDEWQARIPARSRVESSPKLVPTGNLKQVELPDRLPLKGANLDAAFTDLIRDDRGRAEFRLEGKGESLSVTFGPKYPVGIVWGASRKRVHLLRAHDRRNQRLQPGSPRPVQGPANNSARSDVAGKLLDQG